MWRNRDWFVTLKGRRFGLQLSRVLIGGLPYLDRYIVYLGGGTLRLHRFWRGDDARASHTHPWWFVTFPLSTYAEWVFEKGAFRQLRAVRAWRFHFRPATFEHIVCCGLRAASIPGARRKLLVADDRPFWTIVITGSRNKTPEGWGFYPRPGEFIPWRQYK